MAAGSGPRALAGMDFSSRLRPVHAAGTIRSGKRRKRDLALACALGWGIGVHRRRNAAVFMLRLAT